MSVDPAGESATDTLPQTWNRYAMVAGDPMRYTDPTGEFAETPFDVAMAAVSIGQAIAAPTPMNLLGAVLDVAAVVVPGVPAVGGRAIDAAQAADKVVDAAKSAARLADNKAAGKAAEKAVAKELASEGKNVVGSQVSVQTSQGRRVVDHMIEEGGRLSAVEVKSGSAVRNGAQRAKDAAMASEGGRIVGKNSPPGRRGQVVRIQTVERRPSPGGSNR